MTQLPLKARMGFRDLWENPNAPAQKSLDALRELLGYRIQVDIEAQKLWQDLQKYYPDPGTFAPNLTSIVSAWAECLTSQLQDESNAAWTERLLELVTERGTIVRARLEPCNISHVANFWSKEAGEFIIQCPESSPPYSEDPYSSILTDLQNIFEPNSSAKGAMSQAEETDWATVNLPGKSKVTEIAASTALPSVHMLARPEVLFASQVPYHMILQISSGGISVQGSHQPSLQLLKEYLERYAKIDRNDSYKTPILKVELQQSLFGYRNFFDSLSITPQNTRAEWKSVNPVLILSFVESVLGYQSLPEMSSGGSWYFKRNAAFQ